MNSTDSTDSTTTPARWVTFTDQLAGAAVTGRVTEIDGDRLTIEVDGFIYRGIPASEVTATEAPNPFRPGYTPLVGTRIWRSGLRVQRDGTATVTFRGNVADATEAWVERSRSGRIDLYCLVNPTDDTATEIRVAVVPTGKRPPQMPDEDAEVALRLGSVGGQHVYLLSVDGTVDREAFDAAAEARRDERVARRQAAAGIFGPFDYDDDGLSAD